MSVMFPEAFTAEYEEIMSFLHPDYIIVQVINAQPYRMSEPTQDMSEISDEIARLKKAHPKNTYLAYTLTEYEEWITNR